MADQGTPREFELQDARPSNGMETSALLTAARAGKVAVLVGGSVEPDERVCVREVLPEEDQDSLGAELSRMEDDLLAIHDALCDAGCDGAINAGSIIERVKRLTRPSSREPAPEEVEAAAREVLKVVDDGLYGDPLADAVARLRAALSFSREPLSRAEENNSTTTSCPTCGGTKVRPGQPRHTSGRCPDPFHASPSTVTEPDTAALWRVGRKVPIHLYEQRGEEPSDSDPPIGTMLTAELARAAVEARRSFVVGVTDEMVKGGLSHIVGLAEAGALYASDAKARELFTEIKDRLEAVLGEKGERP